MPTRKEIAHATKLVEKLIADELLELVDGAHTAELVQAVTAQLVLWTDNLDRSDELADLLGEHRHVAEVFASDEDLDAAITRWRTAVRAPALPVSSDRNREIEAKLLAEPDDDLAAVYADWLIEHGNPLGELFACATNDAARKRVFAKYGDILWGNIAEYRALFEVTWGPAGIITIDVERASPMELEWGRVIGALLDRPLATFCRALRIGPLPASAYTQFDELLAQIAVRPRAALHRLEVRGGDSWYAAIGIPDLEAGFPSLRELNVSGRRIDGRLAHPTLAQLRLNVESSVALTDVLGRIELPGLRRFAIGTRHPQVGERAVDDMLGAPWLLQLEELDLSGLALDRSARVLLANHTEKLAHLRLVLD